MKAAKLVHGAVSAGMVKEVPVLALSDVVSVL